MALTSHSDVQDSSSPDQPSVFRPINVGDRAQTGFFRPAFWVGIVFLLGATMLQAEEKTVTAAQSPGERRWEVSLETGCLFGLGNPNNYVIAPQFLNLAWQPFPQWQVGPVRFRGQILATFVGEAIVQGPESYFLGGALRFRFIFPLGDSRWSFYADGGGGVDSDDTPFGQGEDFAFCLLASGGLRYAISDSWAVSGWISLAASLECGPLRTSAQEHQLGCDRTGSRSILRVLECCAFAAFEDLTVGR